MSDSLPNPMQGQAPSGVPSPAEPKGNLWLAAVIILLALISAGVFALYQMSHPTTNDIALQAYTIGITARVSGPVIKKNFQDNQYVKEGDLLFEIDPSTYQAAYDKAHADKERAFDLVNKLEQEVNAAESVVKSIQAELENQTDILKRYQSMVTNGAIAEIEFQNQKTKVSTTQESLDKANAELIAAQAQMSSTVQNNPVLRAAEAALKTAELNLSYTKVHAPQNGYITNENLQEGTYVTAGQPLFALVVNEHWWVNARFKETQIRVIRPGDPVNVYLKMYPNRAFEGVVEGTGWGVYQEDGATVDMLPKIDPTVDWVRLANRFNVRIKIKTNLDKYPMRIGATGVVVVKAGRLE